MSSGAITTVAACILLYCLVKWIWTRCCEWEGNNTSQEMEGRPAQPHPVVVMHQFWILDPSQLLSWVLLIIAGLVALWWHHRISTLSGRLNQILVWWWLWWWCLLMMMMMNVCSTMWKSSVWGEGGAKSERRGWGAVEEKPAQDGTQEIYFEYSREISCEYSTEISFEYST